MKYMLYIAALAVVTFLSASCSDHDDYRYPDLQTELVEVYTNASKKVTRMRLDDGREYTLSKQVSATVADTTLRCVCSFAEDDESGFATPYSMAIVASNIPLDRELLKDTVNAPFKMISTWETGRYINAQISYQTTSVGTHQFVFCEDSVVEQNDGTTVAYVSLFHLKPANDPPSYTQKTYASMPKYHYEEQGMKVVMRWDMDSEK